MILNGNEVRMPFQLEYLHPLVVVALADELEPSLLAFFDVIRIDLVPMPVAFIDGIGVTV